MPTPEEEQVNANIDLLLSIQLDGLSQDPVAQQALTASIEKIRGEYQDAAAKAKTSKYYKDVSESIAKCLPSLVKGTKDAAEAFKKGDYISGSAALMDICASVIPVFASLSAAGGPAGALVGALFSVVGQILSFFAPKQPSLEDKIQKMLDHVQSEQEINSITAFGHSVSSYTSTLRRNSAGVHSMGKPVALAGTVHLTPGSEVVTGTATTFTQSCGVGQWLTFDSDASGTAYKIDTIDGDTRLTLTTAYAGTPIASSTARQRSRKVERRGIAEILAMPLTTADEADDFMVAMKALGWALETNHAKLATPVFENWKVSAYLRREENQRKEGWPEVLGIWCQTNVDLLTANMMLSCLADPKTLNRLLIDTQVGKSALPDGARGECHSAVINLKSLQEGLRDAWWSDNAEILKVVRAIRPVARERGLYAHLGYWAQGNVLYIARGNGTSDRLRWDYKKNTAWLRSISIDVPRAQRDSYTPRYELLAGGSDQIWRHSLDPVTGDLSDGTPAIQGRYNGGERFFDAAGIAFNDGTLGVDDSTHPLTLVALAIEDNGPNCYLNYYTIDKNGKGTRVNTEPRLDGMKDVRCLYLPPTTLPGDPDADAMADSTANPPGPPLLAQNTPVVYGGVRNRNVVHVVAWNSWATVQGPEHWTSYNGIEVDPYYLWLFGKGGIACASHASIIKCRQGKIARPTWINHEFDKQFTAPEVTSLYPCVDGTLLVSMLGDIYTADYDIDRGTSRIITSSWVQRGGNAKQVIKMPIPAWSVLESLRANLEEPQ